MGVARILGMEEKFSAGEQAVYAHSRDPDKIILLERHRSYRTDHFVEDFKKLGIDLEEIERAFEEYQRSRMPH